MISSLGINPHECEAMFEDIPTIKAKNHFVVSNSRALRRDVDLTVLENKQALAKNIFLFGQVMEGTQFYGLFGMILSLYRQNKFPGIGQMFRYTLRDESNHIEVFRNLLNSLTTENPDIMTPEFKEDLRQTMAEGVRLEKEFIKDCLPVNSVGLSVADFEQYIDYISDRRLVNCRLEPLKGGNVENPFPWLSEAIDLKKEQNFFEGKVTEYQKASALEDTGYTDDDL
jgi:ribonucleoside-diphosphate reductase beta chain